MIAWTEYLIVSAGKPSGCGIHGETADGHRFHVCPAERGYELWVATEAGLSLVDSFEAPSDACRFAERLVVA